ncbi:MAG: class I SAM-dependent methyltransferase [Desulforegulaceae bacterium]|nr:class I SAM-dependent methyltransferase [Desulforegulaceae bacterium]
MNEHHSKWLTKELSETFSEGVRGAIPGANLQLEIIIKLISVWSPCPSTILDLGCGDGILGRMLLTKYPAAHTVFADFSEPMLEKVRKKIGDSKMAKVRQIDFATSDWINAVKAQTPFDIIVSGFAIHHQPDDRKKALYTEIYNLLKEGGIFLNLDQVRSETFAISEIFDSFFLENIRCSLPNPDQNEMMDQIEKAYYEDKKENIPAPVDIQCQWLRDIGFQEVDCFFKTFELGLFGGKKSSNKANAADAKSRAAD